jgi:putative PIN family toxin of toxin-antitoxin system
MNKRIIQTIILEISNIAEWIEPTKSHKIVKEDPDDTMILDCAIDAKVDFIITGDMHLLELEEYEGIRFARPNDFLQNFLA